MSTSGSTQGHDPRGNVFEACYPLLYAAETPLIGAYSHMSMVCATIAATWRPAGLAGARVLDVGCGYGTTTEAIARFCPAEIVAVDSSKAMTDLMRHALCSEDDIGTWMDERGARDVLDPHLYDIVLKHLTHRRRIFRNGAFTRRGGTLGIFTRPVNELTFGDAVILGRFDVVVANNVLHWPINQERESLTRLIPAWSPQDVWRSAVEVVFERIAGLLMPDGVLIVMEPKEFIKLDDPDDEADAERHAGPAHPAFLRFHTILNELLRERHGIERAIPTTTGLLPVSKLREVAQANGLGLTRFISTDIALEGDFLLKLKTGAPMLMGALDLTFDEKAALIRDAEKRLLREITEDERAEPNWQQYYYLVFTRTA